MNYFNLISNFVFVRFFTRKRDTSSGDRVKGSKTKSPDYNISPRIGRLSPSARTPGISQQTLTRNGTMRASQVLYYKNDTILRV